MKTSDIQPGPFSENQLRQQWNNQADEFNQWDSLDSDEKLAWVQVRAIAADRGENQRRLHRLQQENGRFREPERTILCDLLGNGDLLPDPHGKRYGLKADTIRVALERLVEAIEGIDLEGVPEVDDAITAARAALANAEPASVVKDSLTTAPPELQRPWSGKVAAWSAKLRPADSTPPAEGEVAELVKELKEHAHYINEEDKLGEPVDTDLIPLLTRAAELLQQRHPAPVAVSERPWERDGWCDGKGKCWWGRAADDFCNPDWHYATWADVQEFCSDAMPHVSLPHNALPLPAGEGEA